MNHGIGNNWEEATIQLGDRGKEIWNETMLGWKICHNL